jgi:hypothetical protein
MIFRAFLDWKLGRLSWRPRHRPRQGYLARSASACRPASVIFIYAISIVRLPAIARRVCAVASPVRTSSTICGTVKPCASMIASVQPSRQEASNSRARRRGLSSGRRRTRHVGHIVRLGTVLIGHSRRELGQYNYRRALARSCALLARNSYSAAIYRIASLAL